MMNASASNGSCAMRVNSTSTVVPSAKRRTNVTSPTAGVPVEYRCYDGTIHAFMSFAGAIPLGLEALSFVASRLKGSLTQ